MIASERFRRVAGLLLYLLCIGLFVWSGVFSLLATSILDGESSAVSNVPINYVLYGSWIYPLHAQELFYPGVDKFIIHPPLHYYLVGIWLQLFGIGAWQLLLQSTIAGLLGVVAASYLIRLKVGNTAAVLTLVLATVFAGLRHPMVSVRPDLTFGLIYSLVVLLSFLLLHNYKGSKGLIVAALLGVSVSASFATHWYGFFCVLYLPAAALYLVWRLRMEAWKPVACLGLGAAAGVLVWWYSFGDDFWFGLLTILLKGGTFLEVIRIPFSYYLTFLTAWPGGTVVLLGCALAFAFCCFDWLRAARAKSPISRTAAITSFLALNIFLYELFFFFYVANKAPRYSANIAILLVAFSAIGYFWILNLARTALKSRTKVVNSAAAVLAGAALLTSHYVTMPFSAKSVGDVIEGNLHASIRAGLSCGIPEQATLLLGSTAYQYLYDRPFLGSMRLYAEMTIPQPTDWSLRGLIHYYRTGPGINYRTAEIPYDVRRQSFGDRIDVMVNADHGHGWQSLYLNPLVWKGMFKEYLAVALIDPNAYEAVTGRVSRFPNLLATVFLREGNFDDLTKHTPCAILARGLHQIGSNVVLLRYDAHLRQHRNLMADDWAQLDGRAKADYVQQYLVLLGGSASVIQPDAVDILVDWVDQQFEKGTGTVNDLHGGTEVRTFGQVADRYFEAEGFEMAFSNAAWSSGK